MSGDIEKVGHIIQNPHLLASPMVGKASDTIPWWKSFFICPVCYIGVREVNTQLMDEKNLKMVSGMLGLHCYLF